MRDPLYPEAVKVVRAAGLARTSLLQQHFRIGYSRAVLLIDQMEAEHVIGPARGPFEYRELIPEPAASPGAPPNQLQGDLFK